MSAKHNALLERLECTEIRLSAIKADLRFEAEFFKKQYLKEDAALSRWEKLAIGDFANVTDGPHGYHIIDESSPVAMLTAKCAAGWFSKREGADLIARSIDEANVRSRLRSGDIILSTRGTVGMCALVVPESLPANIDQDVARISWSKNSEFLAEFVLAYLNSRYGQDHMKRFATGMVQQGLSLAKVREIPIPRIGKPTQAALANQVQAALNAIREQDQSLRLAESILLKELGLTNWQPAEPLTYSGKASQAFKALRLDSQYFTPRVADLLAHLGAGERTIQDVAPPRREKFSPSGKGEFRYIEISDIRGDGTATDSTLPTSDAPSRATQYVRAGDVLTSTVRPNRRLSALVMPEQDGCVCSSGFVVLRPSAVAPEVLLTYLRLPLFCELMDLHTSASLYPAISETDLLDLPFPKISDKTSGQIIEAVRAGHAARARARELLDHAKRAVEIAIEESEAAAMQFLQNNK